MKRISNLHLPHIPNNPGRISMRSFLLTYFMVFCLLIQTAYTHPCGINLLRTPKRILFKNEGEDIRNLKSEQWEPLRIHLDYSNIENNLGKISANDYNDLKDKIMPKTKEIFEKLLKVKRNKKNLKLPDEMCDHIEIPSHYLSDAAGVDADIVIFVLVDDTGLFIKHKVEAAAIHCFQETESRRPIAGYIQFKPELNMHNSTAVDYMVWLAIHEITHILVMNDSLYDDWIDQDMKPYGFNKVVGKKILPNGKAMSYIKTPKIIEKGKAHFKCDSFDGLPLEYNGGAGTVGAHWSKKTMNTDYMIGDSYGENLISDLSLAMFEDSGWYQVSYSDSNMFTWGKGKGCDFLNHSIKCVEKKGNKIVSPFPEEFCTDLNAAVCSPSNIFRANCRTRRYDGLTKFENYFDDNVAGIDSLCDKCPIPIEVKNGMTYYGGSCRFGDARNLASHEKVCPGCACFISNLKQKVEKKKQKFFFSFKQADLSGKSPLSGDTSTKSSSTETVAESSKATEIDPNLKLKVDSDFPFWLPDLSIQAQCMEFKCSDDQLYVVINETSYKCDKEKLQIEGYEGYVNCPSSKLLCNEKFRCKFGCVEKY